MKTRTNSPAASLAAVSLILSGCTHLEVAKYDPEKAETHEGIGYMLNFTQYEIELTRKLISCKAGALPEIKTEAKIATSLVPDGEHVYTINPASMISPFKTTDVLVTLEKGRLVTFNATVVGKEGEFIGSVVSSAGKIARLASGFNLATSGDSAASVCTPAAIANLAILENNTKPIADAAEKLETANVELLDLVAEYTLKPTTRLSKKIETKKKAIADAKKQLDRMRKASDESLAWLTDVRTIKWPQESTVFHEWGGYPLPLAVVAKWFESDAIRAGIRRVDLHWLSSTEDGKVLIDVLSDKGAAAALKLRPEVFGARYPNLGHGTDISPCVVAPDSECGKDLQKLQTDIVELEFYRKVRAPIDLHIAKRGSYGSEKPRKISDKSTDGIRYRLPAAGTLYICQFEEPCQEGKPWEAVAKVETSVAQLGAVFNLPFSSPAFASGNLTASFDNDGAPSSVGLKRDNATAVAAANAFGGLVDEVAKVESAKQGAELADLKRATEIATQKKTLQDAIAGLTPDEKKDLTRQIEIAKLKNDLRTELEKQTEDPNADLAMVQARYEATTAVNNAKVASLNSEAALAAAEDALKKARSGS